ncbi:kinase inhibitor [Paenibacillus amylolyticus]|uniref:5-oxoprolinase subunit PxpB n=1 Tax=Paenibacillus TaxID=44249 RepID=UPI0003E2142E|nr:MULTISPECIES: 5-oxoprolinase subunit PxpB [Paenibacillus]ETT42345.1 allophanate hydrolase subunit 1 [Paenibacillus sp. FSL H7-689]OMF00097.1 kinase inhibitor [Paenibacillus amylolyticus]
MTELTYSWTEEILSPLGETAVIIQCGDQLSDAAQRRVMSVCALLEKSTLPAMIEWVPTYTSVTVFYNPFISSYPELCRILLQQLNQMKESVQYKPRTVTIPVCYGGEWGPDLDYVASENGLTAEDVIAIHTSGEYLVHMIGFAPGFPYLGGLSEQIATPRRATPRLRVEAGTVGIGGKQTGIYPVDTPGGWQCIGQTPLRLFRPEENVPSLLVAGDRVRFKQITMQDYLALKRKEGER